MTNKEYKLKIAGLVRIHNEWLDNEQLRFLEQIGKVTRDFFEHPMTTKEDLQIGYKTLLRTISTEFVETRKRFLQERKQL